jgi:DNA-binding GntR family transcriptional regulator
MAISSAEQRHGGSSALLSSRNSPTNAASRVYDDLRERIVSMALPPGSLLSRVELAKEYEVSLTPIREAMQRLEQDGLIKIYPQSKTLVTKIDLDSIFETHFLRVAVETEIAHRLSQKCDPAILHKAKALLVMQKTLVGNLEEVALFNELDEAFHQTLYDGVGQLNLHSMLKAKAGHLARARRLDLPKEGKMRSIVEAHGAILAAIESGDSQSAQEAVRNHLAGTVGRIGALRDENPDYFKA